LTVLAALTLVPPSGWSPLQGGRAEAAECSWQRHAKRVVKQVHRHGRAKRVVRTRRWWACDPLAPPAAVSPKPSSEPAPLPTEPEPVSNRLGVKSAEYLFILSRPSVAAGAVTIELNNQGEDPHNLNLQREGSEEPVLEIAETASQQHQVAQFDLPAGTYRLWCSLPEHDEKGMHATLVVDGG
jgi:plastocyanin